MAIEPAAISAKPARTTMWVEATAPERPAARAKGTVRPSERPMTTSRTVSLDSKWPSMWGWWGCECGCEWGCECVGECAASDMSKVYRRRQTAGSSGFDDWEDNALQ